MTKEAMEKLLATPKKLLGSIDRQRKFLLERALVEVECIHPECDRKVSQLDACEHGTEGYELGSASTHNTFRCPSCKTPLAVVIPFIAVTVAGWQWGKVRNRPPTPTPDSTPAK